MNIKKILNWRKHPNFSSIVMQEEATKKGVPHYQGAIIFDKRVSHSSLKTWVQENIGKGMCSVCCKEGPFDRDKPLDVHTKDYDSWERCTNYCSGSSGNGLMKCTNLQNRFFITKDEVRRIETSIEGIRNWNKYHPLKPVDWEKLTKYDPKSRETSIDRNVMMDILRHNIESAKRYILEWD